MGPQRGFRKFCYRDHCLTNNLNLYVRWQCHECLLFRAYFHELTQAPDKQAKMVRLKDSFSRNKTLRAALTNSAWSRMFRIKNRIPPRKLIIQIFCCYSGTQVGSIHERNCQKSRDTANLKSKTVTVGVNTTVLVRVQ